MTKRPTPVLVLVCLFAACSGKGNKEKKPTPIDLVPTKEAVVIIKDKQISGAWLKSWASTYQLMLMRSAPVQVDEWSLLHEGQKLLTHVVLIGMEAERRGLTVSDQEIEDRLAKEMAPFQSTQEWLKRLEASGMTREDRKQQIRWEVLSEKYRDEIVVPDLLKTSASEAKAREFYDRFPNLFVRPRTIKTQLILRSVAKDAPEAEREQQRQAALTARKRVAAGEKFEDVAREVSTDVSAAKGGEIGILTDQVPMDPKIKEALFKLEQGQMSDVIEGPQGWHLFRADEVKPEGRIGFDEVKADVQKKLLDQATKAAMDRTSADLQAQAVARGEVKWLKLDNYIGQPPADSKGGKPQLPAAPGTGAPAPAADGAASAPAQH